MIGHLQGQLKERSISSLIVDCGGVGYEVQASNMTLASLGAEGTKVALRIFTHFNDSKITLFGFSTAEERQIFDLLITVKNVGPTSALRILSAATSPQDVATMIATDNSAALRGMKGVGKKTAELLVVELRDKCETLLMNWGADGVSTVGTSSSKARRPSSHRVPLLNEVAAALIQLGWKPIEADKAVDELTMPPPGSESLEGLIRQALQAMPRMTS
jgi:Holliday junction DNA helicase RuvA